MTFSSPVTVSSFTTDARPCLDSFRRCWCGERPTRRRRGAGGVRGAGGPGGGVPEDKREAQRNAALAVIKDLSDRERWAEKRVEVTRDKANGLCWIVIRILSSAASGRGAAAPHRHRDQRRRKGRGALLVGRGPGGRVHSGGAGARRAAEGGGRPRGDGALQAQARLARVRFWRCARPRRKERAQGEQRAQGARMHALSYTTKSSKYALLRNLFLEHPRSPHLQK
jgi:hypothetical protein